MGRNPEDVIIGISPLGGNAVEGTSDADADVRDTSIREVPLVFDPFTGTYVAEHRAVDMENDEVSLEEARNHQDELEFLAKAGFQKTI